MKWISIKDKLPEIGVKVIVLLYDYGRNAKVSVDMVQEKNITDATGEISTIKIWYENQHKQPLTVTYWMPFPEPPKDKSCL